MKVLFDHQIFSSQNFGGISTYFAYVYKHLKAMPDMEVSLPLILSSNVNLDVIETTKLRQMLRFIDIKGKTKLQVAVNTVYSKLYLKFSQFDVFHPTYYNPYFLPYLEERPFVITIFDMIHELYPDMFPTSSVSENKKLLAQKASHIIAISESTKKDVVKLLGVSPDKVSVVYMAGNNINAVKNDPSSISTILPKKYILYVGDRKAQYKNFANFIKAISLVLKRLPDYSLVTAGGGVFTETEVTLLKELGIYNRTVCVPLTNKEPMQRFFYENAQLFVYPSTYEGFGIPLIEAYLCNCPTAISNRSCFPEIAQDASLYFDPGNSEEMADVIEKGILDSKVRSQIRMLGEKLAKNFTWENSAKQSSKIYKTLV